MTTSVAYKQLDPAAVFQTTPYAHQLDVWEKTWHEEFWGLFLEMGTGKSKVLLDTIAALWLTGEIRGALIVAPKGVYRNWVEKEIPAHLSQGVNRRVLPWSPAPGKARDSEKALMLQLNGSVTLPILVMNVEALSTGKGRDYARLFLRAHRCLFAIDESTTIKNGSSLRTKAAIKLAQLAPYRRILTGSPITKNPFDAYAQTQFLKLGALGHSSVHTFRNRYATFEKEFVRGANGQLREYPSLIGYQRLDELQQNLRGFTTRVLKSECLDLPDKVYQIRHVEMTDEQRKAYREMLEESITIIENTPAVAQVVITQILRLHQILCGHVKTIDGEVREIPNKRIDALLEVLEETEGKAIVWAHYRHDLEMIRAALTKAYGADAVAVYSGDTPDKVRPEIVRQFQDPSSPLRFFVGQERTGGYGLTLTAASTVVYYSNTFDLEVRLQSEDRAHRIGQTNKVTYVDLLIPGTVDEKIVRALNEKLSLSAQVLGETWKEWMV